MAEQNLFCNLLDNRYKRLWRDKHICIGISVIIRASSRRKDFLLGLVRNIGAIQHMINQGRYWAQCGSYKVFEDIYFFCDIIKVPCVTLVIICVKYY